MTLSQLQIDRLRKTADWVATTREIGFNMNYDLMQIEPGNVREVIEGAVDDPEAVLQENMPPGCGTVGCIAGTIAYRLGKFQGDGRNAFEIAADFLNMSSHEAHALFFPDGHVKKPWDAIRRSEAVRVILDWADRGAGEPDWRLADG